MSSASAKRQKVNEIPSVCLAVLGILLRDVDNVRYFLSPVDARALGLDEYPRIVQHPMDLGTVRRKLGKERDYAGRRFASDVRLTFKNAMIFNDPADPVYLAAAALLQRFELEWAKFGDPLAAGAATQASQAASVASSARMGGLRIKLRKVGRGGGGDGQPASVGDEQRVGVFRDRVAALVEFAENLGAGVTLAHATQATAQAWRAVSLQYDLRVLRLEARDVLSALEDNCDADAVAAWLAAELRLCTSDAHHYTVHQVAAELACETRPLVANVVDLVLAESNATLRDCTVKNWARRAEPDCVVRVLETLLARASGTPNVAQWLDALVSSVWALSSHGKRAKPPSWNALVTVASRRCDARDADAVRRLMRLAPGLVDTVSQWVLLQAPGIGVAVDGVAHRVARECYLVAASASGDAVGEPVRVTILLRLLQLGLVDRAVELVPRLFEEADHCAGPLLALLLDECAQASVQITARSPPEHVGRVTRLLLLESVRVADPAQIVCGALLQCNAMRRPHFAETLAHQFMSLPSRSSPTDGLETALLFAWTPNTLPSALMEPLVTRLCGALANVAPSQAKAAAFALRAAPESGWATWAAQRAVLLAALESSSQDASSEAKRVAGFWDKSVVFNRDKY